MASSMIEGSPEVQTRPVDGKIKGRNTNSADAASGVVNYDILFDAAVPEGKGRGLSLIINIESQQNDVPGYPIPARGIDYACHLIANQHGSYHETCDYGKIHTVYSIWLLTAPTGKKAGNINHFFLEQDSTSDECAHPCSDYNLIHVVEIFLGDVTGKRKPTSYQKHVIRLFNILFQTKTHHTNLK